MKLLAGRCFNPGDKKPDAAEERIEDIKLKVHKFNNRPKPTDPMRILFISSFSEFGCESLTVQYCIPKLLQRYPGFYVVVVGWYGREYLYRHLVDEYWEIGEEHQWLREYARAFHHESKNLARLETLLKQHGQVWPCSAMGNLVLANTCLNCNHTWGALGSVASCPKCNSLSLNRSTFADINHHKKFRVAVPRPCARKMRQARECLKGQDVGIFARNRKCYGRNLPADFYMKLVDLLENMGYHPIWLGEKQSTLPCPVSHIVDCSGLSDLELTLAIICQLEFTVQFWTASTRLASMMGIPWLLFESPDQIAGMGQEGLRIALTTDDCKKKMVLCHYLSVMENQDGALDLAKRAVVEMSEDNWSDIIGLVENDWTVGEMLKNKNIWGTIESGQ